MIQDRAILTTANQYKVIYVLSNGATFNDLERPLTPISRSRQYLTLNIYTVLEMSIASILPFKVV